MSSLPTTKFLIKLSDDLGSLPESNCEKIRLSDVEHIKTDGWLISQSDEVPDRLNTQNNPGKKFCDARSTRIYKMVDPSGMMK